MQIRKCLLAVCFAVAALGVQAADTQAQVKAREALQKKLQEIDTQAPVTNAPAVTNAPTPAAPVPPPAAPAPAAAPAPTPAEVPPPAQPVPPPVAAPAAVAAAAAAPEAAPAPAAQIGGVPVPADPAVIEKAREAMRKKMEELPAETPAVAATPPSPAPNPTAQPDTKVVVTAPEPKHVKPPKTQPTSSEGLPPIPAPDLPISSAQQQRLSALLQRYKADEITPDQYQAERAKILQGN